MLSRLIFISDVHFGVQEDMKAWEFTLSILKTLCADEVILGGDIFDHEALGKYRKKPQAICGLQAEITHGVEQLTLLRKALPCAKFTYYRGNHERRLDTYLLEIAAPLYALKVLDARYLYQLDKWDCDYIPETRPFKRGHLWIAHGDEFATGSTNPAMKALDDLNSNILFGHVHRVSTASKQQLNRRRISAWSNSCLCKLDPSYNLNPNWTQGFTIVDFTKSGYFSVTPVTYWYNPQYKRLQTIVEGVEHG